MNLSNTESSWGALAKLFHWTVALLLFVQLAIGGLIYSLDMYAEQDVQTYLRWIPTHKSIGLTIWLLVVLRLAWRVGQPTPEWPAGMPALQRHLARANHWLLYGLLLVQPVLGLVQSSAYGATTIFFGLFEVPSIVPEAWSRPNSDVVRLASQNAHSVVAVLLILSMSLHILAALKHGLIERDGILRRMLPGV